MLHFNFSLVVEQDSARIINFMHRIVTGDEEWCLYVNINRRLEWVASGKKRKPGAQLDPHFKKDYASSLQEPKVLDLFEVASYDLDSGSAH